MRKDLRPALKVGHELVQKLITEIRALLASRGHQRGRRDALLSTGPFLQSVPLTPKDLSLVSLL